MAGEGLAPLVERNAWTYGPVATALRVLDVTVGRQADPEAFWEPLLEQCPRMTALAYWRELVRRGVTPLAGIRDDCLGRMNLLVEHLKALLPEEGAVLLVGHDLELDLLLSSPDPGRRFRYLVLEGAPGGDPPGGFSRRRYRPRPARLEPPFEFAQLEEALDWADAVVLAGMPVHRQNLLGPSQLRPVLASAREQADRVLLCAVNERRLTLGEGAPRRYGEDFRPYLWQSGATHLVSEWHSGHEGTAFGWLPIPPEQLEGDFGEQLGTRG